MSFQLEIFKNITKVEQTNLTVQLNHLDNNVDQYNEPVAQTKIKAQNDVNFANEKLKFREEKLYEAKRETISSFKSIENILNEQFKNNMETLRERQGFFDLIDSLKISWKIIAVDHSISAKDL